MSSSRWEIFLGLSLIVLSVIIYLIHFVIFRDPHHIGIYGLGDLAFLPVEVLLVTLIIHRLLSEREKRTRLQKLNMVIGAFYSEVGTKLLAYFSDLDPDLDKIKGDLIVSGDWSKQDFSACCSRLKDYEYDIEVQRIDLEKFKTFLMERRNFLLRLLENPNLLEHETFTDLLQAVFHMTEELSQREYLPEVSDRDVEHLSGDIKRVYGLLVYEWMEYMAHLKSEYPYLFSLAIRTNPFDQDASPEFR